MVTSSKIKIFQSMEANLKNLHHNLIIVLSFFYSSYVVSHYLKSILPFLIFENDVSILASVILSYLAHTYLNELLLEIAQKRLVFASIMIVIVLVGLIFSCEYKAIQTLSYNFNIDRTRINLLYDQKTAIENQYKQTGASRNWQKVELRRNLNDQLKIKVSEIEKEEKRLIEQTKKADSNTKHFRIISIFLICLSGIAMLKKNQTNSTVETTVNQPIFNEKQHISQPLEQPINDINKRISLAVEHIKSTGEASHNFLMKTFKLNPQQVKKAKELANYISSPKKKIGF